MEQYEYLHDLFAEQRFQEVVQDGQRILQSQPDDHRSREVVANALAELKQFARALVQIRVIWPQPGDKDTHGT